MKPDRPELASLAQKLAALRCIRCFQMVIFFSENISLFRLLMSCIKLPSNNAISVIYNRILYFLYVMTLQTRIMLTVLRQICDKNNISS